MTQQQEQTALAPRQIVEKRCTKCHPGHYFEEKSHTGAVWTLVVLRMQVLHGAKIERGERKIITSYLHEARPPSGLRVASESLSLLLPFLLALILFKRYYSKQRYK